VEGRTLVSSAPCATEAAWQPWSLCVTVEEPGRYGYRRRDLTTPGQVLCWETFEPPCRLRGLATPDLLVLAVPLRVGPRSRYRGTPVSPDRLPALRCGGVHWIVDRGQSHVMWLVAASLIRRHIDTDLRGALERAAGAHSLPVKPNAVEPLGSKLLGLINEATRGPQTWPPTAVASLEQELLRQLAAAIDVPRLLNVKPRVSSLRARIERALEYLQVASLPSVTLSELREVAGVSQRILEYGIQELSDLTPLGFWHLLRLHAVRRELIACNADDRPVGEIAYRWGFRQHGRFSGYYRTAFGELPSQTLARPAGAATRTEIAQVPD